MKRLLTMCLLYLISVNAMSHGMSAEDQARILNAGYLEYMHLGAMHMLSSYGHLVFLFGVMFFLTRYRDILKFITAFTVVHSITLVFAKLWGITARSSIGHPLAIAKSACPLSLTRRNLKRSSIKNSIIGGEIKTSLSPFKKITAIKTGLS